MKLYEAHVAAVFGEVATDSRRDVGLACSRWTVKDKLLLLFKEIEDVLLKPLLLEMQVGRKLGRGRRKFYLGTRPGSIDGLGLAEAVDDSLCVLNGEQPLGTVLLCLSGIGLP